MSYKNFAILCFLCCFYLAYAGDELNVTSDLENRNSLLDSLPVAKEKRSTDNQELESSEQQNDFLSESENVQGYQQKKRNTEASYNSPLYCKMQGFCGLLPVLSIICMVKCNFDKVLLLKPFLGLITELPMFMCQAVNTLFPNIPKKLLKQSDTVSNVKSYLKLLDVKTEDEADFAKSSANALPVTMIKNLVGPIFDDLKPAVKKLEIHDTDTKIRKSVNFAGKLFGSLLNLAKGIFSNPKCSKTNLDDEALRLISAMKSRKCILDIVMPGYFVFNAAPKVASSRQISALLRSWNMPLLMFTGVKCCMVNYAIYKIRSKCVNKYDILNKAHGLASSNGPDTVCNAIPTFSPFIFDTRKSSGTEDATAVGGGSQLEDEESEEATSVSPCEDENNKNELEECVTASSLAEYSEESKEETIGENVNGAGGNEEVESEEKDY